jgi:hypothetical protein
VVIFILATTTTTTNGRAAHCHFDVHFWRKNRWWWHPIRVIMPIEKSLCFLRADDNDERFLFLQQKSAQSACQICFLIVAKKKSNSDISIIDISKYIAHVANHQSSELCFLVSSE